MRYYLQKNGGPKKYSKSLSELRMEAFVWLAFQEGNMEMAIPLYSEDGKIAETVYLKYVKNVCFICSYKAREQRTFRSYYPFHEVLLSK